MLAAPHLHLVVFLLKLMNFVHETLLDSQPGPFLGVEAVEFPLHLVPLPFYLSNAPSQVVVIRPQPLNA